MLVDENSPMDDMMKEEITSISRTLQAVGPLIGNALKSGQLFRPQAELTEPDPDALNVACTFSHMVERPSSASQWDIGPGSV